jgi:hypothetical protein
MTTDLDMATHALGHAPSGNKKATKPKPMKEFHAKELHDGTFHTKKMHGFDEHMMPIKPDEEGSASDIDGVHDQLHEHMGGGKKGKGEGPDDGEGQDSHGEENEGAGEKKQGHEQKAKHNKDKVDAEEDETPEHGKTDEK